jgi:twinkle protein
LTLAPLSLSSLSHALQVNVILVVHPRKEDDRVALNISSVFGSAKATQEADLVMILQVFLLPDAHSHTLSLQRIEGGSFVDIRKNRYDGQLGKVAVDFNQMTRCFFESDRELEAESTTAPANRFKKS